MNNNKTILRAILCIAILAGFFLPWFKMGGSGLDIVIAKGAASDDTATTIIRYSFLLIPLFALVVLIRSISKQGAGFFLRLLPFLVTAILTALFILGINTSGGSMGGLNDWLQILDIGLYLVAGASLLLIFI